jgi:hypothetical protein
MATKPVRGMSRWPPGHELGCKLPVAPPRLVQVIAYTRWICVYNNLRSRRNSPNDQGPITVSVRDPAHGRCRYSALGDMSVLAPDLAIGAGGWFLPEADRRRVSSTKDKDGLDVA